MRKVVAVMALLVTASCRSSTGPLSKAQDTFGPGALSRYTAYSDSGNPWSLGVNSLQGNGFGWQSVLIRKSVTLTDGWIEALVDSADDGGLVLRFADNDNYYLLAVRDDQAPFPRNRDNLEIYRRTGVGQGGFVSLWRMNVNWPRGILHQVRFEISGDILRVYFDENQVASVSDFVHLNGKGIGVRHYGNSESWITRYHRLSWSKN